MIPKLSVIVPVYNVEQYIERCVESIRNQTLREIELILVDDGSKDKSGWLCDQMAEQDYRIKVIHQQNTGQGIARNAALKIAKGEYVTFVDSDDYVEKATYHKVISEMELHGAQLGCFGYSQDNEKGEIIYQAKIVEKLYLDEEIRKKFILHFFGDDPKDDDLRGVSACMSVYKREVIETHNIRFKSERKVFSEDTLFNLEYCKYINSAISLSESYYHYCLKEDSFTKGYQEEKFELTEYFTQLLSEYAEYYGVKKEVANRMRMVLWISLMDSIKQEVRLREQLSLLEIRKRIRTICRKKNVIELVENLETEYISSKQKVFYYCIKWKFYFGLLILADIRNKRGL